MANGCTGPAIGSTLGGPDPALLGEPRAEVNAPVVRPAPAYPAAPGENMPAIRKFVVTPDLPAPLRPLLEIARNVWWTWNVEAINLLRRVDPDSWDKHDGNPIAVLGSLPADRIRELERDKAFLAHLERVRGDLERYLAMPAWFESETREPGQDPDRLLLPGVRPARVAAPVLGRPGHPGRRPPEVGLRPGPAPGGRGPGLPVRVLPPVPQPRRLADGGVPGQRLLQHVHARWSATPRASPG